MAVLFIFPALVLLGLIPMNAKKYRKAVLIVYHIIAVPLFFIALISFALLLLMYIPGGIKAARPLLNILLTVLPSFIFLRLMFNKKINKVSFTAVFCVIALGTLLTAHTVYTDSIPTVHADGYFAGNPYSSFYGGYMLDVPADFSFSDSESLPVLDGATALYPVYASFFRAVYPQDINWYDFISLSTTSYAYNNIINGKADIIFVAEASKLQEEAEREAGVELVFTPIGSEAFVFIVNSKNPLTDITPQQIADIYTGQITGWQELGISGLDKIQPFQRKEGSGSQTAFEHWFANSTELLPAPTTVYLSSMNGLVETVADYKNFRNAIGYSFRYYCTEMLGGNGIRLLSINGIEPTLENIANGTYPYAGNFYAVTRADAGENILAFLDWMTGPQGQEIVAKVGYTPIK